MNDSHPRKRMNFFKKPYRFLATWRPFPVYELISYVFMFASVPMLAYGIQEYSWEIIKTITLTIATLYSGFFAALIWNDITDADIDALVHPDRPVPKGRISSTKFFAVALVFSAMTFIFALLVSLWCLILVGAAALFVAFHNKYLKKRVKLPAYSELFTPIQWVVVALFGFLALFSNPILSHNFTQMNIPFFGSLGVSETLLSYMIMLAVFTYFADNAHDLPEGIHDAEGDRQLGVKTYATSFGEKNAAKISFCMFFISGIVAIGMYVKTILSPIFLIPFLGVWVYTLHWSYRLIKADKQHIRELGSIVGRKGFDYFLMSYNLIFLDVLLRLLNHHFHLL